MCPPLMPGTAAIASSRVKARCLRRRRRWLEPRAREGERDQGQVVDTPGLSNQRAAKSSRVKAIGNDFRHLATSSGAISDRVAPPSPFPLPRVWGRGKGEGVFGETGANYKFLIRSRQEQTDCDHFARQSRSRWGGFLAGWPEDIIDKRYPGLNRVIWDTARDPARGSGRRSRPLPEGSDPGLP